MMKTRGLLLQRLKRVWSAMSRMGVSERVILMPAKRFKGRNGILGGLKIDVFGLTS